MKQLILIALIGLILFSGCMSPEEQAQREAEQKLLEALQQYGKGQDIIKNYDFDCIMKHCKIGCSKEQEKYLPFSCDNICTNPDQVEKYASLHPECKKGYVNDLDDFYQCGVPDYACKNPINDNGRIYCSREELQERDEYCASQK
ncbi:MAG: hypothetical protein ABH986_01500 [archaeon]